jgi:hypothetical protein
MTDIAVDRQRLGKHATIPGPLICNSRLTVGDIVCGGVFYAVRAEVIRR